MKRFIPLLLVFGLLMSGCSVFSNNYVSVTPHRDSSEAPANKVAAVSNYTQLQAAFVDLVHSGAESGVIHLIDYNADMLTQGLRSAVDYVKKNDAIGAYAVEDITYEQGISGMIPAVAVNVVYRHDYAQIQKIQTVRDSNALWRKVEAALERCDAGIVVLVEKYSEQDLEQMVEEYATVNPNVVMEIPQVSWEVYPDKGEDRVVSVKFTYQNSRTDLREMQSQVQPIFDSAALYVRGGSDYQKLSRLYSFLMERFSEYQIKTSITPSYSLLHHGVGDSRAFAVVYAQMCRMANVECQVVNGTRQGEPWSWNLVESGGGYYHVDLLASHIGSGFKLMTDDQMGSYVWDYSAYPACEGVAEEEDPAENEENSD